MTEKQFDVAIIGGGIQGAGIAAALSNAGLKVFLCEKNDFASGTSSYSTKLIHGGLRYLEYFEFRLVKEALHERNILMKIAPHLITPLEFIMPVDETIRKKWFLRFGFLFYDIFSKKTRIKKSHLFHRSDSTMFSPLKPQFVDAFSYFDCATSDTRLTIENILLAQKLGAVVVNYHECIESEYFNDHWRLKIKNKLSSDSFFIGAKYIINATGPWTFDVAKDLLKLKKVPDIQLVKGSHIIIKKKFESDYAYLLQNKDNRVIFVVPYQKDFQLIGTTDIKIDSMKQKIEISAQEKQYLFDSFNYYFNQTISEQDIVSSFSGVRTLQYQTPNTKAAEISRDYHIEFNQNVISIIGGKLTTYRIVAEKIAKKIIPLFSKKVFKTTKTLKLPGSHFENADFATFVSQFKLKNSWLPAPITERLAKTYGSRAELILQNKHHISDLGKHFGHGLYQAEVEFLIREEFVKKVDDILWRRTQLGLWFTEDQKKELEMFL